MLGKAVFSELKDSGIDVVTVGRQNSHIKFTIGDSSLSDLPLEGVSYIVNCIGMISHVIDDTEPTDQALAFSVNSLFPQELAHFAANQNMKVIQIATDCVFSGDSGGYDESSTHDATDVYGRSKSLGEISAWNFMNLRSSIIGRESRGYFSLLEWVIRQPPHAEVSGFIDRRWNGITTKAFARIVKGVLENQLFRPGLQHIVPANTVSKADLVRLIAVNFSRLDISVLETKSGFPKDLTLSTSNKDFNSTLWAMAGYSGVPTIQELIHEIGD